MRAAYEKIVSVDFMEDISARYSKLVFPHIGLPGFRIVLSTKLNAVGLCNNSWCGPGSRKSGSARILCWSSRRTAEAVPTPRVGDAAVEGTSRARAALLASSAWEWLEEG